MTLLRVDDLTVSFTARNGVVIAVDKLSYSLDEGEALGIVGESGSGKSVSCYSLLGLLSCPPGRVESGSVFLENLNLLALTEKDLEGVRGRRVAIIFQDPLASLNPYMTVGSQLLEVIRLYENLTKSAALKLVVDALLEVGIEDAESWVHCYPFEFSGGMCQRVMIAMALLNKPDILIADEPTTALDVVVQAQILLLIKKLQRARKMAVIFVSHDLALVSQMADKIIVMSGGVAVESGTTQEVLAEPKHPYTQKLISSIPRSTKPQSQAFSGTAKVLQVKRLSVGYDLYSGFLGRAPSSAVKAVKNVSFSIHKGEIFGLVGESGCGKSTIARSVMALLRPSLGEILLNGVDILQLSKAALKLARADFQMIFQDTYASLNPRMSIFEVIAEAVRLTSPGLPAEVLMRVHTLMDEVGLSLAMAQHYPHALSGGQRQRVAIARVLAMKPKLIVADEPVSALDVTIQAQVLELLLKLTRKYHLSVLFISHDLAVIRSVCDTVGVMQKGEIVELGRVGEVFGRPVHAYTRSLLEATPS